MKAVGSILLAGPRAIGHGIRRVVSLVRDDDDVRELYGEHPNGGPTDQQLAAGNLAANLIGGNGTGAF